MDPETLSQVQAFAAITLVVVTAGTVITLLRIIWLRFGRPALSTPPSEDLNELRSGIARLEEQEHRVAELEERVDFAERLLAQQQVPDRLQGS